METRARYVLVGAFTLAVIAAAFAFVYWLNTTGGLQRAGVLPHPLSELGVRPARRLGGAVQRREGRRGGDARSRPDEAARHHGDHRRRARHARRRRHHGRDRFSGTDGIAGGLAQRRDLRYAARGRKRRTADAHRGPGRRAKHEPGRTRCSAPRRHAYCRQRRSAAQHDRQSQQVLGRARAQF